MTDPITNPAIDAMVAAARRQLNVTPLTPTRALDTEDHLSFIVSCGEHLGRLGAQSTGRLLGETGTALRRYITEQDRENAHLSESLQYMSNGLHACVNVLAKVDRTQCDADWKAAYTESLRLLNAFKAGSPLKPKQVYAVEMAVAATLYVRADSPEEAMRLAKEQADSCLSVEEVESELEISGEAFDSPDLPDVSLSPAMTVIGPLEGTAPQLAGE